MKILEKNENLKSILTKEPVVLVKFGADWCGPCKMIDPILEKMSQSTKDALFVSVDVDENKELATAFKVKSIPHIIIYKNGEEVAKVSGFQTNEQIKTLLNKK